MSDTATNTTAEYTLRIQEFNGQNGKAEDPWLKIRKYVVKHPGLCEECGLDICLESGAHDNEIGRAPDERNPWDEMEDSVQRQTQKAMTAHMNTAHGRFARRTMTLDQMAVASYDGKTLSAAERRAAEAKNKKNVKKGDV